MKAIILISIFCLLLCNVAGAQIARVNNFGSLPDTNINYKQPHRSITSSSVNIGGASINYKAVAGTIILKNAVDSPTASIFYTAYFKEGEKDLSKRPVTFLYNGGPGSSTIWLHMGAFGPRRVYLDDSGQNSAPFKSVNNDNSLLDASDLVFIDAPATGFSKIITKEMGGAGSPKDFFSGDQDASAFASFIIQFLSDYNRWTSPKYLFGESYGTFRSALLADILVSQKHIGLNGVILLSQTLTIANSSDNPFADPGNDMPFQLALPTYAAVAWYHHMLPNRTQQLEPLLREAESFAMNEYALALNKGAMLDSTSFDQVARKLHDYTGLNIDYIKKANLRIGDMQFAHELLSDSGMITGRLDARYTGFAVNRLGENGEYDPMGAHVDAPFVGTFNDYVRNDLKYGEGQTFHVSGRGVYDQWDYRHKIPGATDPQANIFPSSLTALGHAMIMDPGMKVMLNSGYFDLGTPYYQGVYEMRHLPMPAVLQKNIEYKQYYSGHMVYLHPESLKLLHDNVATFIRSTN